MADKKLVDITGLERFLTNIKPSLDKADSAIQAVKTINGQSIVGNGNIEIAAGSDVDLDNYYTKSEIDSKGYATASQVNAKQDAILDLDTIRSGAAKGATALQSYTEQYKGTIEAVDTTETVEDVANDFVTSEQLDARGYATTASVNNEINAVNTRVTNLQNLMGEVDVNAKVLWLGTSIPAGDATIDPNNNYPKMFADVVGCTVYNNSKPGSFVAYYPNTPTWTTKAEYDAEFATGFSLSQTHADVETKYRTVLNTIASNEGLGSSWVEEQIQLFKNHSYESLIVPYLDGTLAECDTVIIDHGFNDRSNIFNVCSQHPIPEKDILSY